MKDIKELRQLIALAFIDFIINKPRTKDETEKLLDIVELVAKLADHAEDKVNSV